MIKRLLCYGDSNTWGYISGHGGRLDETTRWPSVMARELGDGYCVIEEGLNGRTTVREDPGVEGRNGKAHLTPCLRSHAPLDLVLLMLGTNDLKDTFGLTALEIANGVETLGRLIQSSGTGRHEDSPRLLLLCPPPLNPTGLDETFTNALDTSRQLAHHYRIAAQALGCAFFDVGSVACSSPVDGVHWDAAEHLKVGRELAALVAALAGGD